MPCFATTEFLKIDYKPVAIVNDTPITPIDIEKRVNFLRIINNIPDSIKLTEKDKNKILNDLIEERIKYQEINRFNVKISDDRINDAFKGAAHNLGLSVKQFSKKLEQVNLNRLYFENITHNKMAWDDLLRGRYVRDITANSHEVSQIIEANIASEETSAVYHQITLPINSEIDIKIAEKNIQKSLTTISNRLNTGEAFKDIALNYKSSSSDLITYTKKLSELPPRLSKTILLLQPQEISQPIKINNDIILIQLIDKQKGDTLLINQRMDIKAGTLKYKNDKATSQQKMIHIQSLNNNPNLCQNFDDYFDDELAFLNTTISELPEALRSVARNSVLDNNIGVVKIVREAKNSDYILVTCRVKPIDYYNDAPQELIARIKNEILNRKISLKNKEYLNNLKKTSVITIYQ